MQKKAIILMVCMAILLETGCGKQSDIQNVEKWPSAGEAADEVSGQGSLEEPTGDGARGQDSSQGQTVGDKVPERSDTDVRKLELTMDLRWTDYEKLRDQASRFDQLERGMSEEEIQELIQSEILRCYEENTLLAVEIKTVVMGSLGCTVPVGFSTGEDVMSSYGDYVKNTLSSMINVQGVIDEIASPEVQDILRNGVEGAVSAYKDNGSLSDILTEAASSITNGVVAGIQEKAEQFAISILDETTFGLYSAVQEITQYGSLEEYIKAKADEKTGGLIGSLAGITDYDTTPGALLQEVSNSANASVNEIKLFLGQDMISSKEINQMMYEYSLFGNAMQTLWQYGGAVYFNWKPNYDKMETLYKRFLRNEIMIEMLSHRGDIMSPEVDQDIVSEGGEFAQALDYIYDEPGLTEEEEAFDNNKKYDILESRLAELESALEELKERVENAPDLTAVLEEYRVQMEEVNAEYDGIRTYSVQNFQAVYDEQGIKDMQRINSQNHAIGEIAKYTPYGIFLNLLTSTSIANSDAYYSNMQSTNEAFSRAYQEIVLKARDAVADLEVRMDFYDELVADYEDVWDEYINMCLLKYMLGDGKINVEEYGQEVKKELYLLALQADAMSKIYGAIYTDQTSSSAYETQSQEILNIVDHQGTGEIFNEITREELSEALMPILEAGVMAIGAVESNLSTPNLDNKYVMIYRSDNTPGGKVHCCFVSYQLIHVHHDNRWIDIYYSKGEPLYINGYYFYNGIALNGTENTDAAAACEEAQWVWENVWSNESTFRTDCAYHVTKMVSALKGS